MNPSVPDGSGHDESEEMVVAARSSQQQNTPPASAPPAPLPKCFCNWKHCRTYQKAFREFKHPLYNGVIKLKFYENDPRSMALKASIDRTLSVESSKRNDWKEVGPGAMPSHGSVTAMEKNEPKQADRYCRYYVARHHFTEPHMKHYLSDRRAWNWNEPLPTNQAERLLHHLEDGDVYGDEGPSSSSGTSGDETETRYVQTPNVPKESVRELLKSLRDENGRQRRNKSGGEPANPNNNNNVVGTTPRANGSPGGEQSSSLLSPKQPQRKKALQREDLPKASLTPHDQHENSYENLKAPLSTHSKVSVGGNSRARTQKRNNISGGNNNNNSNSTHKTAKSTITKGSNDEIVIDSEDYDDSDEEDDEDEDVRETDRYPSNDNGKGPRTRTYTSTKSKRKLTKEDEYSVGTSTTAVLLARKEEENHKLREDLDDCKSQITMLQNIVEQLKNHLDLDNGGEAEKAGGSKTLKKSNNTAKPNKNENKKDEFFSSRPDDDEENYHYNLEKEAEEEFSSEQEGDYSEDEAISRKYGYATVTVPRRQNGHEQPRNRRQSIRRGSIHSRRSIVSRSSRHHSRRGSMRGDDGASVMSRQSLQSISVSIKSLPREIELMDDEDDEDEDYTRGNKDDSSYFDDTRSLGSRSAASRVSRRSFVSGSRIRNRKSIARSANGSRTRRGKSNRSAVPHEIDLSGDELENLDVTQENASTDTLFVKDRQIVDPYGEKGVYTGALSKSTCMPNGKGRLEYEKESRWYEGDWIHGRWTGYGRLSNGDGDFYEGGLKNDHKHGTGVMKFADGRVFEGEYIRGQMIQGKMTYQDGSVYGGSWVDGMRHGRGKCIFVDGSEYAGEFREGNFHGHGKMTWNDGGWYVGNWSNGEMDGRGKEVRPDGSLRHDGEWSGGQPIRSASDSRRRRQQQQPTAGSDERDQL